MTTNLDLQEATRRDDVYSQLSEINKLLSDVPVFPSLVWAWCFDIIKGIVDTESWDDVHMDDYCEEAVPVEVTLKQIFDKFWEDVDDLGINMDLGGEIIEETIRDWMRDNDFLVALDNDGWLDEDEDDVIESQKEEV